MVSRGVLVGLKNRESVGDFKAKGQKLDITEENDTERIKHPVLEEVIDI